MNRRGDVSSPIIVILVTVAALAVAGMTVAWMASTGASAQSQGTLVVVGTPTIPVGSSQLIITLKNVGNRDVTVNNATIVVGTTPYYAQSISPSNNIPAGSSVTITITLTANPNLSAGQTASGSILTNAGTATFTAVGY